MKMYWGDFLQCHFVAGLMTNENCRILYQVTMISSTSRIVWAAIYFVVSKSDLPFLVI